MSAWMTDKVHIDLMVMLAQKGPKDPLRQKDWEFRGYEFKGESKTIDDANKLGLMLARENVRSLQARYGEAAGERYYPDGADDQEGMVHWDVAAYQYKDHGIDLTLAQSHKLIGCYDYQSCESNDWEKTEAHAFTTALIEAVFYGTPWSNNPDTERVPGSLDAPWGWNERKVQQVKAGRKPDTYGAAA